MQNFFLLFTTFFAKTFSWKMRKIVLLKINSEIFKENILKSGCDVETFIPQNKAFWVRWISKTYSGKICLAKNKIKWSFWVPWFNNISNFFLYISVLFQFVFETIFQTNSKNKVVWHNQGRLDKKTIILKKVQAY